MTDFTWEGILDSRGGITKRTLSDFACFDMGYAENSWIRGGAELSRRRVGRGKI